MKASLDKTSLKDLLKFVGILLLLGGSAACTQGGAPDEYIRILPRGGGEGGQAPGQVPDEGSDSAFRVEAPTEPPPADPGREIPDSSEGPLPEATDDVAGPDASEEPPVRPAEPQRWNYLKYFYVLYDGM